MALKAQKGVYEVQQGTRANLSGNMTIQLAGADVTHANPLPIVGEVAYDYGTATGGSTTTLVDSTKSWIVDSLIGFIIEYIENGKKYFATITDNDATTLTFTTQAEAPTSGDPYNIKSSGGVASDVNLVSAAGTSLAVTGGGAEATALRVTIANDSTGVLTVDDGGSSLTVDVGSALPSGDNNIGNVDIVSLPSGNLGQQAMASSLSIVPANNITDETYIGDIKFGESLPAGTNAIGKLAANSGVDIGDVDVTSTVIPTTTIYTTTYLSLSGSSEQLSSIACKKIKIKAHPENAGYVYVGDSTVSSTDAGDVLSGGDDTGWFEISNSNKCYVIGTASDKIYYTVVG